MHIEKESLITKNINIKNLQKALEKFTGNKPFDHCIVDNFFTEECANSLSEEFIDYNSEKWFTYDNPIENKKASNDWNVFPELTYKILTALCSEIFINLISESLKKELYADYGLHGGGWHIHGSGGNLNPHLDYSIHPKLNLERKLNIIIYLSKELKPYIHGGHLGLWGNEKGKLGKLEKEIEPLFNRAVIFDTTQNSWHGMSKILVQPEGIYRKSIAVYYLTKPNPKASNRARALFAPREEQVGDNEIEKIIKLRGGLGTSKLVYDTRDEKASFCPILKKDKGIKQ